MKILNINPYVNTKTISKINYTKPISFTSQTIAKKPQINPFKRLMSQLESKRFERQARKVVEKSKEVISYAIDRQEFLEDKIRQSHDIQQNAREAYICAKTDFAGMDLSMFSQIDEKTQKPIEKISVNNPSEQVEKRVVEKSHDAYIMTDYRKDGTKREVLIKKNLFSVREYGLSKDKSKVYAYDESGELLIFTRNPELKSGVFRAEERFKYKEGQLAFWEKYSTIIPFESCEKAFERAHFKDDKLVDYSEDWTKTYGDLIRAKEIYMFENDALYTHIEDYKGAVSLGNGFSASSIMKMRSGKKVSHFAKGVDLTSDALGYFGKYFEYGKNNNLKYVQVGVDIVENETKAVRLYKADSDGNLKSCHFDAKIDRLGQITSKSEVEL
ncbi:MAG: hypothetical protein E7Z88_04325 [Cyanobacteria bacterium SIG27]|nr:hypothetical protein [Cyanobacteria bacterium SIG27]